MTLLPSYIIQSKVYSKILEENSEDLIIDDVPERFRKLDTSITDDEDLIHLTETINYWDLPIPLSVWEYLYLHHQRFQDLDLISFFNRDLPQIKIYEEFLKNPEGDLWTREDLSLLIFLLESSLI
jgi:hypothetical protein